MVDLALGQFVQQAMGADRGAWDEPAIRALAALDAPPALRGGAAWLLAGDVGLLWARWFLEGLADPEPYARGALHYAHLYKEVRDAVEVLAATVPADERNELARSLAKLLWREVLRRSVGRRVPADRELRLLLWDLGQRCWICGAAFPEWARAAFLGDPAETLPAPVPFVDFYKPRGVKVADLRVEIEHVVAHSAGGTNDPENLRLACGWCNRAKSSRGVLYDAEGAPRRRRHPRLGPVSVPQPFWVVRLLALRPRCEAPQGCPATTEEQELTVAPRRRHGAPNPANLMVVCRDHDPLGDERLVAARFAAT